MTFTFTPAADLPLRELATLFNDSFTGYVGGTVHLEQSTLATMIAQNATDLNLSVIIWREGVPLGFGLISRQGWTCRLAGMGIIPQAQGQQVGTHLLCHLLDQAHARGDRVMELEAFEQNARAVRLYEKVGFRILRRLYGSAIANPPGTPASLTEIDPLSVASLIMAHGNADLPWQVSATHIARFAAPNRGWQCGAAAALISDPSRDTIVIRALIVPSAQRRQRQASRLLTGLWAAFPEKQWLVAPICPEEISINFFEKVGFVRQQLHQVQMRIDLGAESWRAPA